jgi:hypothetical protein
MSQIQEQEHRCKVLCPKIARENSRATAFGKGSQRTKSLPNAQRSDYYFIGSMWKQYCRGILASPMYDYLVQSFVRAMTCVGREHGLLQNGTLVQQDETEASVADRKDIFFYQVSSFHSLLNLVAYA